MYHVPLTFNGIGNEKRGVFGENKSEVSGEEKRKMDVM